MSPSIVICFPDLLRLPVSDRLIGFKVCNWEYMAEQHDTAPEVTTATDPKHHTHIGFTTATHTRDLATALQNYFAFSHISINTLSFLYMYNKPHLF